MIKNLYLLVMLHNKHLNAFVHYRTLGPLPKIEAVLKAADACHEMWLKNGSHCATDEQWPDDTTNEYYTLSRAVRALREKPKEEKKPERKSRDDMLVEAAKEMQRAATRIVTALTQRPDDR